MSSSRGEDTNFKNLKIIAFANLYQQVLKHINNSKMD
jgi:hypothetical protein